MDPSVILDHPWALAATLGGFGLLIGSFLNVVIFRLPRMLHRGEIKSVLEWFDDLDEYLDVVADRADPISKTGVREKLLGVQPAFRALIRLMPEETLAKPRSRCGDCGAPIGALQNIPIVSYLFLRGRCSPCQAPISLRYPAIELVTGLLFAGAALAFGPSLHLWASLFLIGSLVALTFIDADTMLLPDSITLPLLWAGLLYGALAGFPVDSIFGAVLGYLALWVVFHGYKLLTGQEGFGYGDFKLLAALGAWFGWHSILPIVLLSACVGAVVGISLIVAGRKTLTTKLPFGVYLGPAGLVMLFYGQQITHSINPEWA